MNHTKREEVLDLRHFSENPRNTQKEENRENRRTRLTKRLLRESLLELLHEKPVDHITVKELCECAELNRSTFMPITLMFRLFTRKWETSWPMPC